MLNYGYYNVAAATIDVQIGDVEANTEAILKKAKECREQTDLLVFPELCISGYTCGDLFFESALLDACEAALERLRSTLGLSREQVQSMTYKQLAKALNDRLSVTPSCGDAYLYDAAVLLLPPLLDTLPEQTELEEDGAPPLGQPLLPPRSLEERLKANLPPRDSVLGDMEAGSLIQFMDELVAPCAAEFTAIYEQYFRQYGNKTVSELAADCAEMPEAERQTVLYELLIHPFASLEEHPNKRYCP